MTTLKTWRNDLQTKLPGTNSTYPKGRVSCSKVSFVVNQILVFQFNFCGKSPALQVAVKRYWYESKYLIF